MKTKEEVLKHLMEVGYGENASTKIMGFLIGQGLKTPDEEITYKKGEKRFEDFYNWFNSKEVKKTELEAYKEIIDFLMSNVKEVPSYWLEYLNYRVKSLKITQEWNKYIYGGLFGKELESLLK